MAQPYVRQYFGPDCAGVNNTLDEEHIADNELADSLNLIPEHRGGGGLVKRCGATAVSNGAAYAATTTYQLRPSVYCGQLNSYFEECFTTTGTITFNIYLISSGAVLSTAATAPTSYPSWVSYAAADLYSDAVHNLKTTNGTTFAAISNFPTGGNTICAYNGYLFCLVGNVLRWSAINDYETWDATHTMTFVLNDRNDNLVSLRAFNDVMVLWSRKRYFHIQGFGPLDFTVSYKSTAAGAGSHAVTCSTPAGLFWWSVNHGLCYSPDGYRVDFPMLRKLATTFASYNANTPIYGSMLWRDDYQCLSTYCPTNAATANSAIRIDYYPARDAFFLHTGTAAQVAAAAYYDGYASLQYLGSYPIYVNLTAGTKMYCRYDNENVTQDLGVSYTSYALSKRGVQIGPGTFKTANEAIVTTKFVSTADFTLSRYVDDSATSIDNTVTAATGRGSYPVGMTQQEKKIQWKISDNLNQRTKYLGVTETGTVDKL